MPVSLVGLWFGLTILLLVYASVPKDPGRFRWLAVLAVASALVAALALAWGANVEPLPRWRGGLVFDSLAHLLLPPLWAGAGGAMIVALIGWSARYELPVLAAATTVATAGILSANPLLVVALIEVGALAVLAGLLLPTARPGVQTLLSVATGLKYVVLSVVSIACLVMALLLANFYTLNQDRVELPRIIAALFATGFGLAAGLMPFYFALPDIFDAAPALGTVALAGPLQCLAFVYLARTLANDPWLLTDSHVTNVLVGAALGGAVLSGVLMFGQRSLNRVLAFNCTRELGWLAFGMASATRTGWTGALIVLAARCVSQPLLIAAAEVVQLRAGVGTGEKLRGVARALPAATAAWAVGVFATLGLPPTTNFWGLESLFRTASGLGPLPVALLAASGALALWQLAKVTAPMIALPPVTAGLAERAPQIAAMGCAAVLVGLAGLGPKLFEGPVDLLLAGLPFLR